MTRSFFARFCLINDATLAVCVLCVGLSIQGWAQTSKIESTGNAGAQTATNGTYVNSGYAGAASSQGSGHSNQAGFYFGALDFRPAVQASDILITNVSPSTLTLNWTNGNGIRRMVVGRAANAVNANVVAGTGYSANSIFGSGSEIGASSGNFVVYDGTGSSATVTGLLPSTVYHFKIYEYNGKYGSNNANIEYQPGSMSGNPASMLTLAPAPTTAASNLHFSNVLKDETTLQWTNGNGVKRIVLIREGSAVDSNPANSATYSANAVFGQGAVVGASNFVVFDGSGSQVTLTGLTPNTRYFFAVIEYNGTGADNNYLITPTPLADNLTLPLEPVAIAATLPTQSGFTANWNSIAGISAYRLDVSDDEFATRVAGYDNLPVTGTSKNVTGLSPGVIYKYRVRAFNASGASFNSNEESVITKPANPVATVATLPTQTSFTANWNPVTGADGYLLDVSTSTSFSSYVPGYQDKAIESANTDDLVDGLASGTFYYYRVSAVNVSGQSGNSNRISQATIPANPEANTVAANKIGNSFFYASWNAVTGATSYELDVSRFSDNFTAFVPGYQAKVVPGNTQEWLVEGLTPNQAYSFRVRAVNSVGKSDDSNIRTVTVTGGIFSVTIISFNNGKFSAPSTVVAGQIQNAIGGAQGGKLYYKGIAESDYDSVSLDISGDSFNVSVDDSMLDELGVEFYARVLDGTGARKSSNTERMYRVFSAASSPTFINSPFDGTMSSIRIISIPYELKTNDITTIFNSLGVDSRYDRKTWRLAHYVEGQGNVEYDEGTNKIERGSGYWFNSKAAVNLKVGESDVGDYSSAKPFPLTLVKGWNQIGNPYPFDIDWVDILEDNPTITGIGQLWVYNGSISNYDNGNIVAMQPFTGGFVRSDNETDVTLNVNVGLKATADGSRKGRASSDLGKDTWVIPFRVTQGRSSYGISEIGMNPAASLSKDEFDEIRLPRLDEFLDITFEHPEYNFKHFTQDVIPTEEVGRWKFYVESNLSDQNALMTWDNLGFGNSPSSIFLFDATEVQLIDMRMDSQYAFRNPGKHEFEIYFSRNGDDFESDLLFIGQPYPNFTDGDFSVAVSLPGTTDHHVNISIVDMTGRQVQTVFDGLKAPGYQVVQGNNIDFQGNRLAQGLYFIKATVNGQVLPARRIMFKN